MTLRPGLTDILGLIVIFALLLSGQTFIGDPGVGWHLRTGQWIAEHHAVPALDLFLAGGETTPWVANQWLADLCFWKTWEVGGFPLLHLFGILLAVFPFAVLVPNGLASKRPASLALFLATLFVAFMGAVQWFLRPVLFSFSFFAYLYFFLSRRLEAGAVWRLADFLIVAVVFIAWANLHPAFVLGLVLLLVAAVTMRSEGVLVSLVIAIVATFVNPYGIKMYEPTLQLIRSEYFMNLNEEWLSVDAHVALFVPFVAGLLILIADIRSIRETKTEKFQLFAAILFAAMALMQRRYIPFFGIVCAPIVYAALSRRATHWRECEMPLLRLVSQEFVGTRVLWSGMLMFAVLSFVTLHHRLPFRSAEGSGFPSGYPKEAVTVMRESDNRGAIFATPNWGGYLAYEFYPERRVFLDDRNDVAGKGRYEDFFTAYQGRPGWDEVLAQYQIAWVLLEKDSPLRILIEGSPKWKKLPSGDNILFLKDRIEKE